MVRLADITGLQSAEVPPLYHIYFIEYTSNIVTRFQLSHKPYLVSSTTVINHDFVEILLFFGFSKTMKDDIISARPIFVLSWMKC